MISMLEKRLGITLIQRTTRKLNITPAGEAYYKRCLAGLEEIKAAEEELATIQAEPQGLLRVTAPIDLGTSVLPIIVSKYIKKFPKVDIDIILTDRRVDLLSENVDLAIRAGELKDSSMIAKRICTTYFALVASAKYLKEHGHPEHPRELTKRQCLQFSPLGIDTWKLNGPKGSVNISMTGKILINHLEMIRTMALKDEGIAFLPMSLIYSDLKSGKLERILPEWKSAISPVHFVYPAQRFVTPKLSSFIQIAGKEFSEVFNGF